MVGARISAAVRRRIGRSREALDLRGRLRR